MSPVSGSSPPQLLREKEELFYTPISLQTELSAKGRSSQWNSYLFVELLAAVLLSASAAAESLDTTY